MSNENRAVKALAKGVRAGRQRALGPNRPHFWIEEEESLWLLLQRLGARSDVPANRPASWNRDVIILFVIHGTNRRNISFQRRSRTCRECELWDETGPI